VILIREGREVGEVHEAAELALATIGTEAEIREASRYSDGRFDLVAVGTRRFALDGVVAGQEPYLVGHVRPLTDEVGDPARARAQLLLEAASAEARLIALDRLLDRELLLLRHRLRHYAADPRLAATRRS